MFKGNVRKYIKCGWKIEQQNKTITKQVQQQNNKGKLGH